MVKVRTRPLDFEVVSHAVSRTMTVAVQAPTPVGGIKSYYQTKIEAAELLINQKTQNLRRLEAQRNALNARGVFIVSPSVLRLSARFYRDI
jgi:hypothetical protein